MRKAVNVDQTNVSVSALNVSDVGSIETACQGEIFLRKAFVATELSHSFTKNPLNFFFVHLHAS